MRTNLVHTSMNILFINRHERLSIDSVPLLESVCLFIIMYAPLPENVFLSIYMCVLLLLSVYLKRVCL